MLIVHRPWDFCALKVAKIRPKVLDAFLSMGVQNRAIFQLVVTCKSHSMRFHVSTCVGISRKSCGNFDPYGFVGVPVHMAFLDFVDSVLMVSHHGSEFVQNPRMLNASRVMWVVVFRQFFMLDNSRLSLF